MPRALTPEQRDHIAADAARRYAAGESWRQIAVDHGIHKDTLRRLTVARHDITVHPWGQKPIADVALVRELRGEGRSIPAIARELGLSQTAVRTALGTEGRETRYPLLGQRADVTDADKVRVRALYEACPPSQGRPGARATRGPEGRLLAEACRELVDAGVPMETVGRALGRAPSYMSWLLACHDLMPGRRRTLPVTLRTAVPAPRDGVLVEVDGLLVCHECGRAYSNLARHVLGRHDMTPEAYRAAHGLDAAVQLTTLAFRKQVGSRIGAGRRG